MPAESTAVHAEMTTVSGSRVGLLRECGGRRRMRGCAVWEHGASAWGECMGRVCGASAVVG